MPISKKIDHQHLLSGTEVTEAEDECRTTKLPSEPDRIHCPSVDLVDLREKANSILGASVSASIEPRGIGDDAEKRLFAEKGMQVHDREKDTICAFCGGNLTPDRWEELDQLFNDASQKYKEEITSFIREVDSQNRTLEQLKDLEPSEFYTHLKPNVERFNNELNKSIRDTARQLEVILTALNKRKDNLFSTPPPPM